MIPQTTQFNANSNPSTALNTSTSPVSEKPPASNPSLFTPTSRQGGM